MADFEDRNLQLTVLQAVWDAGLLPAPKKAALHRQVTGETHDDSADYNYELDDRIRDAVMDIRLPDDLLAKVESVAWNGGNDVHHLIWTYWDGESDEFDVTSLVGIGACRGLKRLVFIAGIAFDDLSPLAELNALETLHLSGRRFASIAPLRSLPSLKTAKVEFEKTLENDAVVEELRQRGVVIGGR